MKGQIAISRPTYGGDKKKISIQIMDKTSRIRFVDVEIDYDKFAEAITGLSYVDCDIETRNLSNVGKTKESMTFEFPMPSDSSGYDKDVARSEVDQLINKREGWIADKSFSSQNTFFTKDGIKYTRTGIYRWV